MSFVEQVRNIVKDLSAIEGLNELVVYADSHFNAEVQAVLGLLIEKLWQKNTEESKADIYTLSTLIINKTFTTAAGLLGFIIDFYSINLANRDAHDTPCTQAVRELYGQHPQQLTRSWAARANYWEEQSSKMDVDDKPSMSSTLFRINDLVGLPPLSAPEPAFSIGISVTGKRDKKLSPVTGGVIVAQERLFLSKIKDMLLFQRHKKKLTKQ